MNNGARLDDLDIALKVVMPDLLGRLPGLETTKFGKQAKREAIVAAAAAKEKIANGI